MSYIQPQDNSSRRLIGLSIVVLFHAAVGYALVTGLARKIVEVVRQPLETKIIEEVKPPPQDKPPPPPPPPRMAAPPPPYIPPPEVQVQVPQAPQAAISAVTTVKPTEPVAAPGRHIAPPAPAPAAVPRAAPVRTPPVVEAKACDKPEYPSASLRAQETGIVLLAFLIEVNGTVLESKVERSSGFRRLDEAAMKALALCRFRPATTDGKPERAWAKLEYEWKID